MIQIENLTYQYNKSEPILSFPNITLDKGKNLLILGESGIGKSTLLHLLAGLIKPITGKILTKKINNFKFFKKQSTRPV